MASILDSIRTVYTDNYALVKLGLFGYLFFLIFEMSGMDVTKQPLNMINISFLIIIIILYAGFSSIIINNRINQRLDTLPSLNPVTWLNVITKSALVIFPYLIIGFPVINFLVGLFNFDGVPQQVAIAIIQLILVAIVITALIFFSRNYKVKEGFDFAKITTGFPDVLVYCLLAIIFLLIYNVFVAVPLLYIIYSFFDVGPIFRYIVFFLITMNVAFLADYCGQLSFDIDNKSVY